MRYEKDVVYMMMAVCLSTLSTCPKREVGCIVVDLHGRVIGHGFNGVPRGIEHCISPGERCRAIHAEINALMNCHDVMNIHTVYCTCQPCFNCAKALANTSIKRLVYNDSIDDPSTLDILKEKGIETCEARIVD